LISGTEVSRRTHGERKSKLVFRAVTARPVDALTLDVDPGTPAGPATA
jgi:hypothetical protein